MHDTVEIVISKITIDMHWVGMICTPRIYHHAQNPAVTFAQSQVLSVCCRCVVVLRYFQFPKKYCLDVKIFVC